MNVSHRSSLSILVLIAPLLTGCGTGDEHAGAAARAATPSHDAAGSRALWDARISGRQLMSLKRVGNFMGTSDLVKYGSDGSVVVIKMYGGGGSGVERCRLRVGELHRLKADLRRLPLDPPPHVRARPRPTFYTPPSPQYTLTAGHDVETFTQDAMPRDAHPFVRRLVLTLTGHVAACRTTYRTRRA
jgi:hypothetical protein